MQSAGNTTGFITILGTASRVVTLGLGFLPADKKRGGCGVFQMTHTFCTGDGEAELKSNAK